MVVNLALCFHIQRWIVRSENLEAGALKIQAAGMVSNWGHATHLGG